MRFHVWRLTRVTARCLVLHLTLINKPPPLKRDHNRDPNIKALKGGAY